MTLLHVLSVPDWERLQADAVWVPDPFWHLCTPAQLEFVLARHFAGRTRLVVLHLDSALLRDVRWEVSEPGMEAFPHLYGPLRALAVMTVMPA